MLLPPTPNPFGTPGIPPTWSSSAKDLVTPALGPSRLWATLGHGIVNQVYWPATGQPRVRHLGFHRRRKPISGPRSSASKLSAYHTHVNRSSIFGYSNRLSMILASGLGSSYFCE